MLVVGRMQRTDQGLVIRTRGTGPVRRVVRLGALAAGSPVPLPGYPGVQIASGLNATQLQNAATIYRLFRSYSLSDAQAKAAIVNAYRESRIGTQNYGDKVQPVGTGGGTSPAGSPQAIGLFQLHSRGAGAGLSIEDRLDPAKNTLVLLQREVLDEGGTNFRKGGELDMSVAELAAIFTRDIERPRDAALEMSRSRQIAREMFGSGATEGADIDADDPQVSVGIKGYRAPKGSASDKPSSGGGNMSPLVPLVGLGLALAIAVALMAGPRS